MKPKRIGNLLLFLVLTFGAGHAAAAELESGLAALAASLTRAGELEKGLAALTAKDYPTAVRLISSAALAGNAAAQSNLGYMYRDGIGVPKDYDEAQKWFSLAAAQGDALGQNGLGSLYRNGMGVQQDYSEALRLFRLSAAQNHRFAQANLGEMYRDGHGVAKDNIESLRWINSSVAQNNPVAQVDLAYALRMGLGVKQDYPEALRLYRLAAAQGYAEGQSNLGIMYEMGWGVQQDYKEAARWYQLAAAKGNGFARQKLEVPVIKMAAAQLPVRAAPIGQEVVKPAPQIAAQAAPQTAQPPAVQPAPIQTAALTLRTEPDKGQAAPLAQRRALVIGNDSYQQVAKLQNAREDARAIAQGLSQVGYQVTLKLDLNEKEMKVALRNFKAQVEGGDEVMIFYAGHGVQIGAANYLLATDIAGESEEQIKDDGIQLQKILDDMSERKAKFTLAMIDACRDNPFKKTGRALGGRGLSPTTAATGQMVIFSAGAGQQALDKLGPTDQNKNGLFTRIFLKEMQKPGVSVDRVLRNVRNDVVGLAKSVGHEQVPAIYDQVVGEFYFRK